MKNGMMNSNKRITYFVKGLGGVKAGHLSASHHGSAQLSPRPARSLGSSLQNQIAKGIVAD